MTKRLAEVKCSSTKKVDPPETILEILNNRLQNLTEELNSKMAAVNHTLSDHSKDLSELKNLNSELELSRLRKENAELKNENAMLKNENEQITERVNNLNLVLADLQNKASSAEEEKASLITSIRLLYKDLESTQPMNTNTIAKVDEQSNRYQSDKHHVTVSADEAGGGHYTNIPTKNRYSALSVDEANAENVPIAKKPDASTNLSSPEQRNSERKNAKQSLMHLSIDTPTPPTPGHSGAMWGILWYLTAFFARGGRSGICQGFVGICL
jgi:predicted  nucleic acid-binding Zn-ribbon protein